MDSDADANTGRTIVTTLAWGETDLTWDAGIVQLGSLGDRVWLDTNRDGIQDPGEDGIPGVTLVLAPSAGSQ